MSNLFISHSSRDNQAAKALQARLADQGHRSVFLDLDPDAGIQAGVSWERTLYTKLRACRAVVALCSASYLKSQWCFAEIALARMEGKDIFALQIDPFDDTIQMPSILTEHQFIDLRSDPEDGYRRLWNGFKVKGIVPAEQRDWRPEDPPYPGLRAFTADHAPIFFGRETEILEGTELLNQIVRQGHPRLAMVMGSSGSGKSSLVRAGIVPQLKRDAKRWTVVPTFRPGATPLREVSVALSDAFAAAENPLGWEDIYRWLDEDETPAEQPALADLTPAAARERLLEALEVVEDELVSAGEDMVTSFQNLRSFLSKRQDDALDSGVRLESNALADLGLRLRVAARAPEAPVVLVIDQFEELLGHGADHPASKFLTMLRVALEVEGSPFLVIGTMRSDFLGLMQAAPELQGLGRKTLSVGPMSRDGMRQVIEEPAKLGAVQLQDGLSARLLDDTGTADALPLLAFTLRSMWDRFRDDHALSIAEYEHLGGLQGAVAQVAEETFQTALDLQTDATARARVEQGLRDAFLSMARPAAQGAGWARNPVSWDQIAPEVQPLLDPFIDPQRLLVKRQDGTVEVAHEALFRSWDRLCTWLDQNAEALHLLHEVNVEAAKWAGAETSAQAEYLWSGGRLIRARELRDGGVLALDDQGLDFIQSSIDAEEKTARQKEAARRRELKRTRMFAGVVGVAFVAACALGVYAWDQRDEAARQAQLALQQSAVVQAKSALFELDATPVKGLATAIQATDTMLRAGDGTLPTEIETVLIEAIRKGQQGLIERMRIAGDISWAKGVAFHPDGTRIMAAGVTGFAQVFSTDGQPGVPRGYSTGNGHQFEEVDASPNGKYLIAAGSAGIELMDWDNKPFHPEKLRPPTPPGWQPPADDIQARPEHDDDAHAETVAIAPDSGSFVIGDTYGRVHLYDIAALESGPVLSIDTADTRPNDDGVEIGSVAFGPDGRSFASGRSDGIVQLWALDGSLIQTFQGHRDWVEAMTFSKDGKFLLTASDDQTVRRWTLGTGASLVTEAIRFTGHINQVKSVVISPDGQVVATAGEDRTIRLWTMDARRLAPPLRGHAGPIFDLAFSPDGRTLVSSSLDETMRVWDLPPFAVAHDEAFGVAVSPDGAVIATGGIESSVKLWDSDLDPLDGAKPYTGHPEFVGRVGFSAPDEVLSFGVAGIEATDLSGARIRGVGTPQEPGHAMEISADRTHLAIGNDAGLGLVMTPDGAEVLSKEFKSFVRAVAVGPEVDGDRVVAFGQHDGLISNWTLAGEDVDVITTQSAGVTSLQFSADGTELLSADRGRKIQIFDLQVENRVEGYVPKLVIEGHTDVISTARYFWDERFIVSASEDNTVRVWRRDGRQVGLPMTGHGDWVLWLATDEANRRVYTVDKVGVLRRWDLDYLDEGPKALLTRACGYLMRNPVAAAQEDQAPKICTAH